MFVHSLASKYARFVVLVRQMYWTPLQTMEPPIDMAPLSKILDTPLQGYNVEGWVTERNKNANCKCWDRSIGLVTKSVTCLNIQFNTSFIRHFHCFKLKKTEINIMPLCKLI